MYGGGSPTIVEKDFEEPGLIKPAEKSRAVSALLKYCYCAEVRTPGLSRALSVMLKVEIRSRNKHAFQMA